MVSGVYLEAVHRLML